MSIERMLRDLLSAPNHEFPPDAEPDVAIDLVERWLEWRKENEPDHVRRSTAPFFASDATGCARQTAYNFLSRTLPDAPGPTDPPTVADEWRFALGNAGHDIIQAAIADTDKEVRAVLQRDGADLVSSRADLFEDGLLVELKTAGGYKFKAMTTDFPKGQPPEGPSWSYVVQLALTAKALHEAGHEVKRGVVVVLAMENLAKNWKVNHEYQRFCAQWSFTWAELEPIADKAIARLQRVAQLLAAGEMPPRNIDDPEVPRRAIVVDPGTGRWEVTTDAGVQGGKTWMCGYCRWQTLCVADAEAEAS